MDPVDLSELRKEYSAGELDESSVSSSPFEQFNQWFQQASLAELAEPNAMIVATVDPEGHPTQRTVLLKYFDREGFVFFTNYGSRKARQIETNHRVSLHFPWYDLQRQVEINGTAEKVSTLESIRYFSKRPRDSQLGAWVSQQSSVVSSRSLFQAKWEQWKEKFAHGEIPYPDFWGGFRVRPERFEFWQGRPSRLHDRIEYRRNQDQIWAIHRLSP
jgi:pyridoxamine 5'-phosphate oxidase